MNKRALRRTVRSIERWRRDLVALVAMMPPSSLVVRQQQEALRQRVADKVEAQSPLVHHIAKTLGVTVYPWQARVIDKVCTTTS